MCPELCPERTDSAARRRAEALHVYGVAGSVPGSAEPDTEPPTRTLQEQAIVGVAIVALHKVVVDVLHRHFGLDSIELERLQLQHDERSRRVLRERLIDLDRHLMARPKTSFYEV